MSEKGTSGQAAFELKAPTSGAGALDPRSALLLWGGGSILLGTVITYLLVQGEFRLLVLLLLGVLGLACLAPLRGVFLLMAFLPFMYLIRRSVLVVQEFAQRDPILVFPVIVTLGMTASVMIFYGSTVFHYLRRSALLKACAALMVVFLAQVVNPLQGSILIGLAGGMFFIIPMLWLLMGLLVDRKMLGRLLVMVLVIGILTSIYGLYQHFFGLSQIEIYELRSKHFLKAFEGLDNVRVMSTFSGLADFARYLTLSGFIAFAFFWHRKRALYMLAFLALQMWAMLYTAVRTSFLVTLFSIVIMMTLTGRNTRRIVLRGVVATLVVIVLYGYSYQFDPRSVYRQEFSSNPFVVHTMSGMTHPTEEGSFQSRMKNWSYIVRSTLFEHPWGRGLGTTTTAAIKFSGGARFDTDSFFFELFYGSGIAAPIAFVVLVWLLLRALLQLCLHADEPFFHRVVFALLAGILLSSVFGLTFRDNIVGPFAWLLIGWVAREAVDLSERTAAGTATTGAAA